MTEIWPEGKAPQYGPNTTTLKPGVRFGCCADGCSSGWARARMEEDGRRRCVAINPALLDGRE